MTLWKGVVFGVLDLIVGQVALLIDQQIQRAEIEKAKAKPPETLDVCDLSLRGVV